MTKKPSAWKRITGKRCFVCHKPFTYTKSLNKHMNKEHPNEIWHLENDPLDVGEVSIGEYMRKAVSDESRRIVEGMDILESRIQKLETEPKKNIFSSNDIRNLINAWQDINNSDNMDEYQHGVYDGLEFVKLLMEREE